MGLSLSNSGKGKLLEQCASQGQLTISEVVQSGKLISFVGDNLDMRIKPRIMTSEKQTKDIHFYMSKVVVSRISAKLKQMDKTSAPVSEAEKIENYVNNEDELEKLQYSYEVIISRILADHFPSCKFMRKLYPAHIPHELSSEMKEKSESYTSGISFFDEKKLEDCVCILDETTHKLGDYLQNGEFHYVLDVSFTTPCRCQKQCYTGNLCIMFSSSGPC